MVIILGLAALPSPYPQRVGAAVARHYGSGVTGAVTGAAIAVPGVVVGLVFLFVAGRLTQKPRMLHCDQCQAFLVQEGWPTLIVERARCAKCGAVVIAEAASR